MLIFVRNFLKDKLVTIVDDNSADINCSDVVQNLFSGTLFLKPKILQSAPQITLICRHIFLYEGKPPKF